MLRDRLGRPYQAALPLLDTTEAAHLRESLTRLVDLGADASSSTGTPCHARSLYLLQPRWRSYDNKGTPSWPDRTQEILQLLCHGHSNEEISASLFISVRSVGHHMSAIPGKLGSYSRKGAAKEAQRFGPCAVGFVGGGLWVPQPAKLLLPAQMILPASTAPQSRARSPLTCPRWASCPSRHRPLVAMTVSSRRPPAGEPVADYGFRLAWLVAVAVGDVEEVDPLLVGNVHV